MFMDFGEVIMLKDNILKGLNLQINREFYSSYAYFSMALFFKDKGLKGLEKLMKKQAQEELEHATGIIDYIYNRNSQVQLETVEAPHFTFSNVFEVFETALEHEKNITKSLCSILETSQEEKDHMTESFIQNYIDEQVEEENFFSSFVKKCALIKEDQLSLIVFDNMIYE